MGSRRPVVGCDFAGDEPAGHARTRGSVCLGGHESCRGSTEQSSKALEMMKFTRSLASVLDAFPSSHHCMGGPAGRSITVVVDNMIKREAPCYVT